MKNSIVNPVDELLAKERERRPSWRNSASKPSPAWFRGQELDVIGVEERRLLFDNVDSAFPRVRWQQLVLSVCWLPLCLRRVSDTEAHWLEGIGAILFIGGLVGATYLRRSNVVRKARRMLRDRADWPQRLYERRS